MQAKYQWLEPVYQQQEISTFAERFQVPASVAQICLNRGIQDEHEIRMLLNPDETLIHDPFLLYDMSKAVERIEQAIQNEEKILVYGDYDADGVTSTTIMVETLETLGAYVEYFIPNRFTEGYGPNLEIFKQYIDNGTTLIITVDNGVQGHQEIEYAQQMNCDVIVTDHHELPENLPNAYAIVHPQHPLANYPFKDLAGVGVAFKVAHALLGEFPEELLDLVAIGTISDMVSLLDENRFFVKRGLEICREHPRIGIAQLLIKDHIDIDKIDEETIGFSIGPKLNAVGRLDSALPALELLMTHDETQAKYLVDIIDNYNLKRKEIVTHITEVALQQVELQKQQGREVFIVSHPEWNEGVLGIVASKIIERYQRPVIVLTDKGDLLKGSARSIPAFHIYHQLVEHASLLLKFGGHPMAAGLSLLPEHLSELHDALDAAMKMILNSGTDIRADLRIDMLIDKSQLSMSLYKEINLLKPFGFGFAKPKILIKQVTVEKTVTMGSQKEHMKLSLLIGTQKIECLAFNKGYLSDYISVDDKLNVIAELSSNTWNNKTKLQLMMIDMDKVHQFIIDFRNKKNITLPYMQKNVQLYRQIMPQGMTYQQLLDDPKPYDTLLLMQLPESISQFTALIQKIQPKQIYLILREEQIVYYDGLPKREQFVMLYKILKQNRQINLNHQGQKICQYLKVTVNQLKFMLKVFFELEFIIVRNGEIEVRHSELKTTLTAAPSYQQRQERLAIEQLLLFSKKDDIINYVNNNILTIKEDKI